MYEEISFILKKFKARFPTLSEQDYRDVEVFLWSAWNEGNIIGITQGNISIYDAYSTIKNSI